MLVIACVALVTSVWKSSHLPDSFRGEILPRLQSLKEMTFGSSRTRTRLEEMSRGMAALPGDWLEQTRDGSEARHWWSGNNPVIEIDLEFLGVSRMSQQPDDDLSFPPRQGSTCFTRTKHLK